MAPGEDRLNAADCSRIGRFSRHDIRRGMDVYAGDGNYQGSVRRVRLSPAPSGADGLAEIAAFDVGRPWRLGRRMAVDIGRVRTVSMERIVLAADTR